MSDRTVTIPDEILDSVISDSHIEIIARKYLVNWETLRPHLSHITEAQEQNIANRQDQDDEWKRRRLLSLWKKEAGDEATYRSLITAAEKSGDFNLANNIRKLLHNEIPSTPSTGITMSSNSGTQQRPELPATHTSTAPSPQHPLQQSTANSRPAPTASSQPLQQTNIPPYQQSHLSSQKMGQYPTHPTALLPQEHSYTTHISQYPPSPPPSNTPQNPPSQPSSTQLLSSISYSPQYSTLCPPSHPPSLPPPHPVHHSQYIQSHPYPPTHTPTQYTQPPTDRQSPTPHYPHQYQPPVSVRPPLAVSSTTHPSPQPTDSYEPSVQPPQVPGTRTVSGSVLEETVPAAKIARLEPSHSALSQHQHNITNVWTTDRSPSVSQLRATQTTAHPTPPNPLLTDDSSVSRQPTLAHTSATPPLQPHSQSSGSDHPHTTTAVSESLVHHHTRSQPSSHSLSSQMKRFINYVKALYKGYEVERNPKVVKLQKMPTKVYINLVCIDRNNVRNTREYDEVTEAMVLEGSVDVVHGKKWPIDFNEIAANLPATSSVKVILVEGAPGVGKSTFAWEFCRKWERGEFAQQYQLVLLLRLREERISNARGLEDLFYHPSGDVCHTVIKELEENLGVNTLIILEGFDELPDGCRSASSVFLQLILGELLPLATVMVTSRPWATRVLREECSHRIFQHVEILGFTDQQCSLYVKSVLPEKEAIDFEEYLASHPQIKAGMYIPLNSAIVVTVYEESKASGCTMPATLTELYTSLVRVLLRRYLRGHPEYGTHCKSIQTFKDLPQAVYTKFSEVCKLAYTGTVGSRGQVQLIYRKCNMPSGFDDLGLMDSAIELYETRPEATSYNFLHLTFQEFFAALHISSLSAEEQVEHFKRHEEGRLEVVLRFLAGINKLNCFSIEEITSNFFHIPSTHRYLTCCDAAVGIDFVQWLFEAQSDDVIKDVLRQKTIEFYQSSRMLPLDYYSLGYCVSHSQCQWELKLWKIGEGETEVKMLVAGTGTRSEPRGRVVGLGGALDDIMYTKFAVTMSTYSLNMLFTSWRDIFHLRQLSLILPESCDHIIWPDLSTLQVLHLGISDQTECKLNTLLPHLSLEALTITSGNGVCSLGYEDCVSIGNHVISTTSLKELCIIFENTAIRVSDEKGMEAITAALASNQSLPLERLELECECTLTATAGDSLAQFIANTTTLKYLVIMNGCVNTVETITAALASNQSLPLEELDLGWECTLNATAGDSLAQFITNTPTLKHFLIVWCTLSAHVLLVLARATHHNSILETKNVDDYNLTVNGDSEAKDLAQLLVEYPDMFRDVDTFSSNSISDAGAVALAQALHHNSTLLELNLSNNSISDAGAVALAQALHHNSTLLELNVSYNSISDAGAVALAQALHHNSTLTELNLSKNNISDAGAVALAQALHHNSTLTELNLSKSNISDAGTEALAQVILHNSTLTQLNLSGNDGIGEEGICQLVQALTVNTSIRKDGLTLPGRCKEYATKCQHYSTVKNRVSFRF